MLKSLLTYFFNRNLVRPTTVSDVSCVLNVSVDVKENIPILWSLHSIGAQIIYTYIMSISFNIILIGHEILKAKYYSDSYLLQCFIAQYLMHNENLKIRDSKSTRIMKKI